MSSKIVLLTGKPRSGKTTLMEALLNEIGATDAAYTAVSPADMRGDRRVGFTVRTSMGTTRTFATRQEGEYAVDVAAWDDVAAEIDAARLAGKVLLIDEIGPMQARSAAFRTAVEAVLADERATLIATLAGADEFPLRKSLLLHHRSTIISLDRVADRHSVAATLRDATVGAIELSTIMPRSQW